MNFVIVTVNTTSCIASIVASHFWDASQECSLSAQYLMLGTTDQVYSFNCFFKAGRVLISEIVAGKLFQVHGPATSKARSPILVLVPGTKTSDLLQSSDVVYQMRWCAVVKDQRRTDYFPEKRGVTNKDLRANRVSLKSSSSVWS